MFKSKICKLFNGLVRSERGSINVKAIMGGFVVTMVVLSLIPTLVTNNATIQALAGASDLTKFAGNLAEWGLPLGAVAAVVMAFMD